MLYLSNNNLLCCNFDNWEIVAIIVNIVTLIVTCVINLRSLSQTRNIHKHSIGINLYKKRKDLLNKLTDNGIDVSYDLELVYGRKYYRMYSEIKKLEKQLLLLNQDMDRLETYIEEKGLNAIYQELQVRESQQGLNDLHDFYVQNTFYYYDEIEQQAKVINGNEVLQELNTLRDEIKRLQNMLKDEMEEFIIDSINIKL